MSSLKRILQKLPARCSIALTGLLACVGHFSVASALDSGSVAGIRVKGPGVASQLIFACCDQGESRMLKLFSDAQVSVELKDLHAELAIAISDVGPERAELVRSLNHAGIPVIAWLVLPKEQGSYLNADNEPAAAARFAAFDAWSREQGLRWEGVGLDIEPNFAELSALKRHWWRLSTTLLRRTFDGSRLYRARQDYSALIGTIRSRGYPVQTYQMPFLSVEREAHSSLFDRMLGTVDVRGDQEYMMLYTSFARPVGGAMIWTLGPNAQAISIGVTDGGPGTSPAPLNWDEFSRDLILASHFSHFVGVYNLEGCVNQGFLPRLKSFDWSGTVIIPADTLRRTDRVHRALRLVLWIGTYLLYLIAVLLLAIVTIVRARRIRNRNREFSMRADSRS